MTQRKINRTPETNKVFVCPSCGGNQCSSCIIPDPEDHSKTKRIYHCNGDDTRAGCGWRGWAEECLITPNAQVEFQEGSAAE